MSAVDGMSSTSASHTSGDLRCSLTSASRGRPYSRTSTAVSAGVRAACARAKPSTIRGRPSVSPPRTIHSNRPRCAADTSSVGLPAPTCAAGWARRSRSRCDTPSRRRYFTAWYASASTDCAAYHRPMPRRSERPQPRKPSTNCAKRNRCVPVRATRGSASSAARRVSTSPRPAAIASANSAGSFLGARPVSLTSTIAATVATPSAARQRATASALASVSARSDA